ncbi:pimeloyl-ACP methyl ester carboxylesterase [Bradyrhizobium sp. LB7.1]
MERAVLADVRGNLSSTRQCAAAFLDNYPGEGRQRAIDRQSWSKKWRQLADDQCRLGELDFSTNACGAATEAWLGALTAFEVARRLPDQDDPLCEEISEKIKAVICKLELSQPQKIERVIIAGSDGEELTAYYLLAGNRDVAAPAVICISMEEESETVLLGRLLPVVIGRGMSVLVLSHEAVSKHSRGHSQGLLSECFDHLSVRPDVDAARIGVYGEGSSAVLASEFAESDHRVAAAVCDGGVWNWTRRLASIAWMTKAANVVDEALLSARRAQSVRRLRCPVLVVAGGRAVVSVAEAIKLQTDCIAAHIDLDVAMPRVILSSEGYIENFVTSDECIFSWLEHQLGSSRGAQSTQLGQDHLTGLLPAASP